MNTRTARKTAKHVLLIASLVGATSCATEHYRFNKTLTHSVPGQLIEKRVALVLQPAFCSYTYQPDYEKIFEVGEALCTSLEDSVRNIFSDVIVITSGSANRPADADLIATPKVVDMSILYRTGVFPVTVDTDIMLEWSITDATGAILAIETVQGTGEDERMWGIYRVRYQDSVQDAIDDLVEKSTKYLSFLNG